MILKPETIELELTRPEWNIIVDALLQYSSRSGDPVADFQAVRLGNAIKDYINGF